MADLTIRTGVIPLGAATAVAAAATCLTLSAAPPAAADTVAYLVNVTVRPGYNFPNPDAAIAYGNRVCQKVHDGTGYNALVGEVKRDFKSTDDYQGAYLINQAVNELCPNNIWQLRNAAIADNRRG